jgi:uncharacterized membrane protein
MIVLFVLVITALAARTLGGMGVDVLDSWPGAVRAGLAVMLVFTAIAHFKALKTDLVRMVPSWVPNPLAMVRFTGLCEILGGVGPLVPWTRPVAAIALIVFFVAVFPANVHAARHGISLGGRQATPLWLRAPMQLLFIGLTWWSGLAAGR